MSGPTIGLFGTCGRSVWRDRFVEEYTARGIAFYNPQVQDWNPACAKAEAEHLATDEIILFPVTDETFGLGSLAEVGFSILNALRLNSARYVIVMVDRAPDYDCPDAIYDPLGVKLSTNARTLVRAHLAQVTSPFLVVVDSLDEMLAASLEAHDVLTRAANLKNKYGAKL